MQATAGMPTTAQTTATFGTQGTPSAAITSATAGSTGAATDAGMQEKTAGM